KAGKYLLPVLRGKNVLIVCDEQVAKLYLHRLTNALEDAQIRSRTLLVKPGEGSKSLMAFGELMEALLAEKPDRKTTLIALGGGVVGDLTGFAASVLLRGVDFVQIPTTLLSQVDSSVGGKTGINSRWGKNLIGSFHQPRLVLADVATLATLPKRELLAGYAEVLKYGLINDPAFFAWLEANGAGVLSGDAALLTEAVTRSCAAKAAIVAEDETEQGARALLNLGHTFGHALEAETGYGEALLHGEAVAIGMVLALQVSSAMGLCAESDVQRVLAHYRAVGLMTSPREVRETWDVAALMEHFTRDKKVADGKLTFILLKGIGKSFTTQDVNADIVRDALARACGSY
ncbi:MAG: 3-dehydroquinate synthase, partial [Rickettsiales bacterium]|nr:3-dehydroquinate synthase [Rickettsiales bacterium]